MQALWVLPLAVLALGGVGGGGAGAQGSARAVTEPVEPVVDVVIHNRVAADSAHSCALTPAGKAICWGDGEYGRLGNGDVALQERPVPVAGGRSYVSIGVGLQHSCGLTAEGDVWCWGRGSNGRLGNGATADQSAPVQVVGGHKFTTLTVGRHHACGLTAEGRAYCWGYGGDGKLGNGATTSSSRPIEVHQGSLRFKAISAGSYITCGIATDGDTYCWGSSTNGKLGAGESDGIAFDPRKVLGGHRFAAVYAGHQYACALTAAGEAYCWGANGSGQRGDGTTTRSAEPVPVSGGLKFTSLSVGKFHTCGIVEGGKAYCWGSNGRGKAGIGNTRGGNLTSPTPVVNVENFASISVGHDHTCGVTTDQKLYCWGSADFGRLGTGGTANRASPQLVADLAELEATLASSAND